MFFVQLIRKHILFIIVISILSVVMTYPTIQFILDDTTIRVPSDIDIYMKFWDAWYLDELLEGRQDFYFASNLFFPEGVSLSYHNFNLVHMGLMYILKSFLGIFRAYYAVNLMLVLLTSIAGYLYLNLLFKDKYMSLLGTVFFGFTLQIIAHPAHPDLAFLAPIPLALYFVERSIVERHRLFMIVAGMIIGLTIFIGVYIYICLLITVGFRILMLLISSSNFTNKRTWLNLVLLALIVGVISMIRVYPMIVNSNELQFALQKGASTLDGIPERRSDLLMYFVNYENPLFNRFLSPFLQVSLRENGNFSYLGYTAIFLSLFGFLYKKYRSKMIFWLLVFTVFFMLRLGSVLVINGEVYSDIVLPKKILNDLVPFIFRAFHISGHFQIGISLPLAIMASYGAFALLGHWNRIFKYFAILLIIMLSMIEIGIPLTGNILPLEQLSFHKQLAMSDDTVGALVNLPMGREESKLYGFYQTFNHLPHVEGLASRTPAHAYNYIENNDLLSSWQDNDFRACRQNLLYFYQGASMLLKNGVQFVVFHKNLFNEPLYNVFEHLDAYYDDEFVRVYELETMIADCMLNDFQVEFLEESLGITYIDIPTLVLHNLAFEQTDNLIEVLFLWERYGEAINQQLSVSLQILDANGNKIQQLDYYLPFEAFDNRNLSIDNLESGTYQVHLVVYNHVTGKTQLIRQLGEDVEHRKISIYTFEIE